MRDRVVALVEEQEREVAVVVRGGDLLLRETVEDRRQVDARLDVAEAVGDGRQRVEPVRERRRQDRREEPVAARERRRDLAEERQILLAVIPDRIKVVLP